MIKTILKVTPILVLIMLSCSSEPEDSEKELAPIFLLDSFPSTELTEEQELALDVFTTLQVSTDKHNRIFSTFANIEQPYYPPDTSFVISQSEFLVFMKQFVALNCTFLSAEKKEKLATLAVLAQDEYTVLLCESPSKNYKNGIPTEGIWVFPSILDERDVVMVW